MKTKLTSQFTLTIQIKVRIFKFGPQILFKKIMLYRKFRQLRSSKKSTVEHFT